MASRAILPRKRYLFDSLSRPTCLIRVSYSFEHDQPSQSNDFKSVPSFASQHVATTDQKHDQDATSVPKNVPPIFRVVGSFRPNTFGISTLSNGIGRADFVSSLAYQSIRYTSTNTAGQPEYGRNEQQVSGQKKEASPEDCDQAVEGLSTVKAKAKAKHIQDSQKSAKSVMMSLWAKILGIGPALRAVASMSRFTTYNSCNVVLDLV